MKKFFEELGAELKPRHSADGSGPSLTERVKVFFHQRYAKNRERTQYLKEQKTLKHLEDLLLRAGGLSGVHGIEDETILEEIHMGASRAVSNFSIPGYDFFGKIIGKDRIVGDTFASYQSGKKTVFYFGDATGHGVQAGFTVAELSKLFNEYATKKLAFAELFVTINNRLKENLKGRVFVTAVFFEHDAETGELRMIGGGHDPFFLYRAESKSVEKIIPGGLAMGVRMIQNLSSVKIRTIPMGNRDVIFGYTDGFIESRDLSGNLYGMDRLMNSFHEACKTSENDPERIFEAVLTETKRFAPVFADDVSAFVWVRNSDKDVVVNKEQLQDILNEVGLKERETKLGAFKNLNRAEIVEVLKKERHEAELKRRLLHLDRLYQMGEFLKLKQKVQENIREGYVSDKMTKYLEKVIANEDKIRVSKLEEKLRRKYDTLLDLHKKGENEIVIREIVEIITR
jgi:hypothetical protein